MAKLNNKKGWLEEIADKSNYSIQDVKSVIEKYDIQQSPNTGFPKHLQITELTFSGTKEGKHSGDFDFCFENLKTGIYGIMKFQDHC